MIKKIKEIFNYKKKYINSIKEEFKRNHNKTSVFFDGFDEDKKDLLFNYLLKTLPEVIIFKDKIDYHVIMIYMNILKEKKITTNNLNIGTIKNNDFNKEEFKKELAKIVFENQIDVNKGMWVKKDQFLPLQTIVKIMKNKK